MISGFTIVRNAVDLGYPFIESIRSALSICDEFIISEGYSSDRTWKGAEALARRYPDKIRVRRDRWTDTPDDGAVIARVSNLALAECTSKYCLYLQANEIIHEDSLKTIAALPERFPGTDLFALPFYNILGPDRLWLVQNRCRLFRRKTGIGVTGDGYEAEFGWEQAIRAKLGVRPTQAATYLLDQSMLLLNRPRRVVARLPQPIYRYRALFPSNYLQKIAARKAMAREKLLLENWEKEEVAASKAAAKWNNQPAEFWDEMSKFFTGLNAAANEADTRDSGTQNLSRISGSPRVMNNLKETWSYAFDASLREID